MAFQEGVLLRNAKLNAINANLGAASTLTIFSGGEPANCAAPDPAGPLVTINLPVAPFALASSGAIAIGPIWSGVASNTGIAASFRLYDSLGNCAMQGNTTTDLVLNSINIATAQPVTVVEFTLTSGNA